MNQVISDNEISSCQELEEMRQAAERAEVERIERHMDVILRLARGEAAQVDEHRYVLQRQLDSELQSTNTVRDLVGTHQEAISEQIKEISDLHTQITNVALDTVNLLSSLRDLREQNHATLRADPIYVLMQEERSLQQQLVEMGIYVHPSTGSDEADDI